MDRRVISASPAAGQQTWPESPGEGVEGWPGRGATTQGCSGLSSAWVSELPLPIHAPPSQDLVDFPTV